jgi:hypothetical protein
MGAPARFLQRFKEAQCENFSPKVSPVKSAIQDDFINLLEFRQGKFLWEEAVDNVGVPQLCLQALQGIGGYRVMVVSELRQGADRNPSDVSVFGSNA